MDLVLQYPGIVWRESRLNDMNQPLVDHLTRVTIFTIDSI
jgi:hypothetical protein